jgi:hypothetical protein
VEAARAAAIAKGQKYLETARALRAAGRDAVAHGGAVDPAAFFPPHVPEDSEARRVEAELAAAKARHDAALQEKRDAAAVSAEDRVR